MGGGGAGREIMETGRQAGRGGSGLSGLASCHPSKHPLQLPKYGVKQDQSRHFDVV